MKHRSLPFILALVAAAIPSAAQTYRIGTVAGSDPIRNGRPAERAPLDSPRAVAFDAAGRMLIAEANGHRVRRVTPDLSRDRFPIRYRMGLIETIAGVGGSAFSGDGGPAALAHLSLPAHLAVDPLGNIYIGEGLRIRRIDTAGVIRTVAGGGSGPDGEGVRATSVALPPAGLALDSRGNIYASESLPQGRVRRISSDGAITTVAGGGDLGFEADGGPATRARLLQPAGLAFDREGNLLICERNRFAVRKITPEGVITTVAGSGVRGYAGDGGPAKEAQFMAPSSIAVDDSGTLLILDLVNGSIRTVSPAGIIQTIYGPERYGSGMYSLSIGPGGFIVVAAATAVRYLEDTSILPVLDASLWGNDDVAATDTLLNSPRVVTTDPEGHLYIVDGGGIRAVDHSGVIVPFGLTGMNVGDVDRPNLLFTVGIAAGGRGELWISDSARILRMDRYTGASKWIAGTSQSGDTGDDGPALEARIENSEYLVPDPSRGICFRGLVSNSVRCAGTDGFVRRVAGNGQRGFSGDGGPAAEAQLSSPMGLAVDACGTLYIADSANRRIRAVSPAGIITTFAGGGSAMRDGPALEVAIPAPMGLAVAPSGDLFFTTASAVYRVTQAGGWLERVAGGDLPGYGGDGGPALDAKLNAATSLWIDAHGVIFVADYGNHRIRKLEPVE